MDKHIAFDLCGIRIRDFPYFRKVWIPYRPELILSNLRRFRIPGNWRVYSTDLEMDLDMMIPIGEQGVREGDTWEVFRA
jgi:hypothetical protein